VIAEKAKKRQQEHGHTAPGRTGTLRLKSAEVLMRTRDGVAHLAGVGHDTLAKAKVIAAEAPEEVKEQLRTGRTSVNAA
jgi:hypothetical protein